MTRFYVLEHSGYAGTETGRACDQEWTTEVLVLDRAYSHRVMWSSRGDTRRTLPQRRAKAQRIAADLNTE